jgi:hypothetical protein
MNMMQMNNDVTRALVANRIEDILEAHANNLIENLDMGEKALSLMLERAQEPIDNDEFVKRGKKLLLERYSARR